MFPGTLKYRLAWLLISTAASWTASMIWDKTVGTVYQEGSAHVAKVEEIRPDAPKPNPLIVDGVVLAQDEKEAIAAINLYRKLNNLPEMKVDQTTMDESRAWAKYMAETGQFRHDTNGISRQGFRENIAWGQETGTEVAKDWMNSPGHKRAIMYRQNTHFAVAAVRARNGRKYWCARFINKANVQ